MTDHQPHSDLSDDDVMQALALLMSEHTSRFGREATRAMLDDMMKALDELEAGELPFA